jgi:hypothetical protein
VLTRPFGLRYNVFHEHANSAHWSRIFTDNSKYSLTSSNGSNHIDDGRYNIARVCDVICGIYFDPAIWKKGTVIECSIAYWDYINIDGEDTKEHTYRWQIVLNNDDGFYQCCFGDFGIFPILCLQYTCIVLSAKTNRPEAEEPMQIKIAGINLASFWRSLLVKHHPSPSWSMFVVKGGYLHGNINDNKRNEDDRLLEWNHLDWAANRIKKALREWAIICKTRRLFQKAVMAELRSLPGLGSDYFDCLQRWPKPE